MENVKESIEEIAHSAIKSLREVVENATKAGDHATARAACSEIIKAAYLLRDKDR